MTKVKYLDIFYLGAGNLNEAIIWFDRAFEINNNHLLQILIKV